jgi:hypothetical protein
MNKNLFLSYMPAKNSAENVLQQIAKTGASAVVSDEEREVSMVEQGLRIPNIVLRKTVEQLRAKKMPDKKILGKILLFDELAEKNQLIEYLEKKGGK